jgi:hypothetical protein
MDLLNMELDTIRPIAEAAIPKMNRWMLDPLDDGNNEETIALTLRQIVRVTLVATEVGARFQREGIGTDPMAWMLAPRRAFDGAPPVEACVTQAHCARAVLIHGLGLDLDIGRRALDALMEEDVADDGELFEQID